jgi:mRNA-degrading endonuclease toxin of MazEF toxin-antitoxin module
VPRPRQGEIWWANLPAPAGRRPVFVLTRDEGIATLSNVTVAPLTRSVRYLDTEVVLTPDQGVPSLCAISLDNILTIPQDVLDRRILRAKREITAQVFDAIRAAFAMP